MKYTVINPFRDLQDKTKDFPNGRVYAIGDSFPATKKRVSMERIESLLTKNNKAGMAVIKEVGE